MALNFSTENCTDRTYIDDVREDGTEVWHPAVQSMAFATMSLGINKITEDNWATFYDRYIQHNVALGYGSEFWYLTPQIVESFVGFKTNASVITDHKWKLELAETVKRTATRLEAIRPRPFTVRFTGERITEESASEGMPAESGWVNIHSYSRRTMIEDRSKVTSHGFDTLAEAQEYIDSQIGPCEPVEAPEGAYYQMDAEQDIKTGDYFKYAAHIEIQEKK